MAFDLLTIGILALDFIISVWNSYAAGYNISLLYKEDKVGLTLLVWISSICALILGFVGTTYVLSTVIGFILYSFSYISGDILTALLAINFLVFGLLITVLGIIITIESVVMAVKRRSLSSILVSIFNIGASIWNVFTYISNFGAVGDLLRGEDKDSKDYAVLVIAVAAVISIIITYLAFRMGMNRGGRAESSF